MPPPDRQSPCVHQARSARRRDPNQIQGHGRQCTRWWRWWLVKTGWPVLLTTLFFLLKPFTINPSDPPFGETPSRCRRSPAQRDALRRPCRATRSSPLSKAALPSRDVAATLRSTNYPQAQQARRSPVSLEGLTLDLTGSRGGAEAEAALD
jgi:hypothetical protein